MLFLTRFFSVIVFVSLVLPNNVLALPANSTFVRTTNTSATSPSTTSVSSPTSSTFVSTTNTSATSPSTTSVSSTLVSTTIPTTTEARSTTSTTIAHATTTTAPTTTTAISTTTTTLLPATTITTTTTSTTTTTTLDIECPSRNNPEPDNEEHANGCQMLEKYVALNTEYSSAAEYQKDHFVYAYYFKDRYGNALGGAEPSVRMGDLEATPIISAEGKTLTDGYIAFSRELTDDERDARVTPKELCLSVKKMPSPYEDSVDYSIECEPANPAPCGTVIYPNVSKTYETTVGEVSAKGAEFEGSCGVSASIAKGTTYLSSNGAPVPASTPITVSVMGIDAANNPQPAATTAEGEEVGLLSAGIYQTSAVITSSGEILTPKGLNGGSGITVSLPEVDKPEEATGEALQWILDTENCQWEELTTEATTTTTSTSNVTTTTTSTTTTATQPTPTTLVPANPTAQIVNVDWVHASNTCAVFQFVVDNSVASRVYDSTTFSLHLENVSRVDSQNAMRRATKSLQVGRQSLLGRLPVDSIIRFKIDDNAIRDNDGNPIPFTVAVQTKDNISEEFGYAENGMDEEGVATLIELSTGSYVAVDNSGPATRESGLEGNPALCPTRVIFYLGRTPNYSDVDEDGEPDSIDSDIDGDGISNETESASGTDPVEASSGAAPVGQNIMTSGSNPQPTGSVAIGSNDINTFFEMQNWLSVSMVDTGRLPSSARSNRAAGTKVSAIGKDVYGNVTGVFDMTLNRGEQFDVDVNRYLLTAKNMIGTVDVVYEGEPGDLVVSTARYQSNNNRAPAALRGDRSGNVRSIRTVSSSEYQYGMYLPGSNGHRIRQYVTFNTYPPSLAPGSENNLAANWVTLVCDDAQSGTLSFFDSAGTLLGGETVALTKKERRDFSGHRFGAYKVGIVEWKPSKASVACILRNVRYIYDNPALAPSFDTAFPLEGIVGSGLQLVAPLDTSNGSSIVEVGNVLDDSWINAKVDIYAQDVDGFRGALVQSFNLSLAPKASQHIITDSILNGRKGIVVVKGSLPRSTIAVVMQYVRTLDGGVEAMYGIPAHVSQGLELFGGYNTFLNQQNEIWLLNKNARFETANITIRRFDGTVLTLGEPIAVPAHGTVVYSINNVEANDNYGQVQIQLDTPGSLVGWIMRKRSDYVMVTPVQIR